MKPTTRVLLSLLLLAVLAAPALAGESSPLAEFRLQTGTGEITGTLFFDARGNGLFDGDDYVIGFPVEVQARDAFGQVVGAATSDALGAYRMTGLAHGVYTVSVAPQVGLVSSTGDVVVSLSAIAPQGTANFGVLFMQAISGTVFNDLNSDGSRSLREPRVPGVTVRLLRDVNGNGVLDPAEEGLVIGSLVSDVQGNYVFSDLWPGYYILVFEMSGSSVMRPVWLVSGEGRIAREEHMGLVTRIHGKVWADLDGDEVIDDDESPLPAVAVALYGDADQDGQPDSTIPVTQALTSLAGDYSFTGPLGGAAYVMRIGPAGLPATGWVPSIYPAALAFTQTQYNIRLLNVGMYDPLTVAPMRVADWKQELKQVGKPRYSPADVNSFITTTETSSGVFPEQLPLADALLLPPKGGEGLLLKQYAALRLNVASSRLLPRTPVNLPELTPNTTVGNVIAEIESALLAKTSEQYKRLEKLADALNSGKGIGYGMTNSVKLARAFYYGKERTADLKTIGNGTVDAYAVSPIFLQKWSPGTLDPNTRHL